MRAPLTQSCPIGYTVQDVGYLGEGLQKFMVGQTVSLCNGKRYNYETREFEPSACADHPHGIVIYPWDLDRYLRGLPPLD